MLASVTRSHSCCCRRCSSADFPLDAHGDPVGDRRHRLHRGVGERLAGEHRHHAHQPVVHQERVARKGHHALPLRPPLVAHTGIDRHGVGQVRPPLLGDQADLVLADRNPAVRAVQVGVQPGAGLEFENVPLGVERPDAGEGPVQVAHQGLGTALEHGPQLVGLNECRPRPPH